MAIISIIAAVAANGAIGADNRLLCRMPNDMKRFKRLTTGHTVIMGRKTFESLPKGALTDRTNIVISGNSLASFQGCEKYDMLHAAINQHQRDSEIFIIGGASIYQQTIDMADKLYITHIHHSFEFADTFFPEIKACDWVTMACEDHPADDLHLYPYTFKTYFKKKYALDGYNLLDNH